MMEKLKLSIFDAGQVKLSIFDVGGDKLSIFDVGGEKLSIFDVGEYFWRLENFSILATHMLATCRAGNSS